MKITFVTLCQCQIAKKNGVEEVLASYSRVFSCLQFMKIIPAGCQHHPIPKLGTNIPFAKTHNCSWFFKSVRVVISKLKQFMNQVTHPNIVPNGKMVYLQGIKDKSGLCSL
jgi:hypothetical protein